MIITAFILGYIIGGLSGILIIALCRAAKWGDRYDP